MTTGRDSTMTDNHTLWELVEKYDEHMQAIGGCSDGGCVIVTPKGMHTNGGCRCFRDHLKAQRLAYTAMNLRKGLSAILERPVVDCDDCTQALATADATIDLLNAALASRKVAVPEGYVLVKRDDLENCINDARRFIHSDRGWDMYGASRDKALKKHEAMLASQDEVK